MFVLLVFVRTGCCIHKQQHKHPLPSCFTISRLKPKISELSIYPFSEVGTIKLYQAKCLCFGRPRYRYAHARACSYVAVKTRLRK